jgi:hypothetical protein
MTVPGRDSAASMLVSLDPPRWHLRHSRAVAEIAGWLALRAERLGLAVDRRLVESAALLHDVDKILPAGDPAGGRLHGAGSAAWLAAHGAPELGPAAAGHPVTRLVDAETAERWLHDATLEERLVAYADKRAGQRLESMAARFAAWARRYPDGWDATAVAAARARAERLEADICDRLGIRPTEVGRLRWTGPALRRVRALASAA